MDLESLYGGSYISWAGVADSWAKRTVASRMLLFAARRYLATVTLPEEKPQRAGLLPGGLPKEVVRAFASVPDVGEDEGGKWGEFMDAALAAEFEMAPYGERPPMISELREGLSTACGEAGEETPLGLWFAARREALPGFDLSDGSGYLPV